MPNTFDDPKLQALWDRLRQLYPPITPNHAPKQKRVRHTIPESWQDYRPKRPQWRYEMRHQVLRTSLALLDEVGQRRFTVKEVARRAGFARSTIYKYFGTKAELLGFCVDKYWSCGPTAFKQASERTAHNIVVDALVDEYPEGPAIVDLIARVATAWSLGPERDLWLLAAAEGLRSVRQPRRIAAYNDPSPSPLRSELRTCLWTILQGSSDFRDRPSRDNMRTLLHAVSALVWYEAVMNGTQYDEDGPLHKGPSLGFSAKDPLRRDRSREQRRHQASTLKQALSWLLQGAGIADQHLTPLQIDRTGIMSEATSSRHPTGRMLSFIQMNARYNAPQFGPEFSRELVEA